MSRFFSYLPIIITLFLVACGGVGANGLMDANGVAQATGDSKVLGDENEVDGQDIPDLNQDQGGATKSGGDQGTADNKDKGGIMGSQVGHSNILPPDFESINVTDFNVIQANLVQAQ